MLEPDGYLQVSCTYVHCIEYSPHNETVACFYVLYMYVDCSFDLWFPSPVTEMLGNVLSLKDEDDLAVDEDEQVSGKLHNIIYMYLAYIIHLQFCN